jgi:hypothetical protein
MRGYAVVIAFLLVSAHSTVAQHASSSSAPGVLGNPAKTRDTLPPVISLADDKGTALQYGTTRSIKISPNIKNRLELKPDSTGHILLKGTVEDNRSVAVLKLNSQKLNLRGEPTRKKFGVRLPHPPTGKIAVLAFIASDEAGNKSQKIYEVRGPSVSDPNIVVVLKSETDRRAGEISPILGKYWALVIGVGDYSHPSLKSLVYPVPDAQEVYNTLTQYYSFDPSRTQLLPNPTRAQLIGALSAYAPLGQTPLGENDNLLVFYAGHGQWDENYREGYWLPSDAEAQNRANWVSNSDIQKAFRAIQAKHILLLSDACFAGSLFATREAFNVAVEEAYKEPSRKAITAGNLTKVPDRSVFKGFLVKQLKENANTYLDAGTLYNSLKTPVTNNSETRQRPIYGTIQDAGDAGGEFIFVKRN